MSVISSNQLLEQLRWRYATKVFDPARKISAADWSALEDALVLSPSSFGLQPWKFVTVADPGTRQKLLPVSWGQRQVVDASHLVVFAVKTKVEPADIEAYLQSIAEARGVSRESLDQFGGVLTGFAGKMDAAGVKAWAMRQAYIALGNFLTSAALLGIDACPMEGFDPAQYDAILGLPELGYNAAVMATAGYRAGEDKYASLAKVRFPKDQLFLRR